MLKKLSFLLAVFVLAFTGCADEDLQPAVTQDTLLFGAFPRLQQLIVGEFDLANLSTSAYQMEVDFVDNAGGADVAQYNVYVAFDDNNPDNGDLSTESALFKSFTPSDFSTNDATGNLGLTVSLPFSEVASFVGAGGDGAVIALDRFQFRTEIVKADGRTFSSVNSTPAVTNAFGGIWNFNVTATCPLADDAFAGDYTITYSSVYDAVSLFGRTIQAFGPDLPRTVSLGLIPGSTTRRVFTTDYLSPTDLTSSVDITLEFNCDAISAVSSDSGVRCSGAGWRPVQEGGATFNLMDESSFEVTFSDFGPDNAGGCGAAAALAPQVYTVLFSK